MSRCALRLRLVSPPGHLAYVGGVRGLDRGKGDAFGPERLDDVGHAEIGGDSLGNSGQPGADVAPVVGIIEDGDERVTKGIAGVVELHQHVADTGADLAVLLAGDLLGDPLSQRHEMFGYGRSVVAQSQPGRERLPACEGDISPNGSRGVYRRSGRWAPR